MVLALLACDGFGINEKNSYIAVISSCCNSKVTWSEIYSKYKIRDTSDVKSREIILKFKKQPFPSKIIYFENNPEEYIGIGNEGSVIRYLYNENLSSEVLDGFSSELSESEKIRITLRLNSILFNSIDEYGRREAIILLKKQCEDYLENNKEEE